MIAVGRAPAKINLVLEVVRRRSDGLHEIRSIVQLIDLCDQLTVRPARELELDAPAECGPPRENLVWRAAQALAAALGEPHGALLTLQKRIPPAAGLGGGSSDAAATLRLLAHIWSGWRRDHAEAVASQLGSDVPLFMAGHVSMTLRGRGERVEPLPRRESPSYVVLAIPPFELPEKTRRVYSLLTPREWTSGVVTDQLAAAWRAGEPIGHPLFFNGLEQAAWRAFSELERFKHRIESLTSVPFVLSGAGPTYFHLTTTLAEAEAIRARAVASGARMLVVATLSEMPSDQRERSNARDRASDARGVAWTD